MRCWRCFVRRRAPMASVMEGRLHRGRVAFTPQGGMFCSAEAALRLMCRAISILLSTTTSGPGLWPGNLETQAPQVIFAQETPRRQGRADAAEVVIPSTGVWGSGQPGRAAPPTTDMSRRKFSILGGTPGGSCAHVGGAFRAGRLRDRDTLAGSSDRPIRLWALKGGRPAPNPGVRDDAKHGTETSRRLA